MVYDISYKFLIGAKPLCIRFHKAVYDGNRYLALFSPEKFDAIYNEIRSYKSNEWYCICFFQ